LNNSVVVTLEIDDQEFLDLYNDLPDEIKKIEGIYQLDIFALARKYFNEDRIADMSVDANANVSTQKSFVNFSSEIEKPILKLRNYYLLFKYTKERFGSEVAKKCLTSIFSGRLYFNDITKIDIPYCFAGSTTHLMIEGRPYGHLYSKPATRNDSFIAQCIELLMDLSQENAGAIALADIFVNYSWYSAKERACLRYNAEGLAKVPDYNFKGFIELIAVSKGFDLSKRKNTDMINTLFGMWCNKEISISDVVDFILDHEIGNQLQQFIHVANNQFRVGGDSPFSNVSLFDEHILKDTFADHVYPDGTFARDNVEEIMRVQYLFAELFSKGDPTTGLPYRFPVTTINVSVDEQGKVRHPEYLTKMAEYNALLGCFNWHRGEKIASCCRMVNDPVRMSKLIRSDTFGNGGTNIGSDRVVPANLHRIALESIATGTPYFELLDDALDDAAMLLVVHKKDILSRRIKQGFLKFFKLGWQHENMFFSTLGFTGLADALEMLGKPIQGKEGYALADKILTHLDDKALEYSETYGLPFNVEEIPGESACGKLLQKDKYYFPDLVNRDILANQIFPLSLDMSLNTRISKAGKLMDKVSGGSIMHINIKEGYMNPQASAKLITKIIEKAQVPHFALNFGFSRCENGHTIKQITEECPICGGEIVEQVTRVVGYFSPVTSWSKPRQQEFAERRWLDILQEEENNTIQNL
jgi:ribonucleoside-triphosphate reductase